MIDEAGLSEEDKTITVVIPVRDRLGHAQQSSASWLEQELPPFLHERLRVLVVDYGCPQETFDWVCDQRNPRLDGLNVLDAGDQYHYTRPRNIGLRAARPGVLISTDADMIIDNRQILIQSWSAMLARRFWSLRVFHGRGHIPLPLLMRRIAWVYARGYDEAMSGWGFEDVDMHRRLQTWQRSFDLRLDGVRMLPVPAKHQKEVSQRPQSRDHNEALRRRNGGRINPDGFGCCRYEYYRGRDNRLFVGQFTGDPVQPQATADAVIQEPP